MRRLILAALLVLLAAPPALAQVGIGKDGQKDYSGLFMKIGGRMPGDSTMVELKFSTDGYPLVQQAFPDWGLMWKYQGICQNSLANTSAASDSSQAYSTLGANWLALRIYYTAPTLVLIAVQVRGGYNTAVDSLSIAGWETIRSIVPNVGGATARDTFGTVMVGSPFEKFGGVSFGIQPNEIPVWLSNTDPARTKYVMLCKDGVYFRAPYTSVRWRVARAFDANMGTVTTGSTTCQIDLIGGR